MYTTHGMSKSPEYVIWRAMKQRCYLKTHESYPRYGGRGIKVYELWRTSFEAFYAHIGPRPSAKHSLDRFPNNNGNYEPGNVRWATKDQQGSNMRRNRFVLFRGASMPIVEAWRLAKSTLPRSLVHHRIKLGWPIEAAMTAPRGTRNPTPRATKEQITAARRKAARAMWDNYYSKHP